MAYSIDFTPIDETAVAYSYIRFSSPEQAEGDSLRRQTAKTEAWCQRNGIQLDTSLTLRDLGVSAFRGRHRDDKFALGHFLKMVERGRVPKGSYLIIENLDRLSREDERKALRLWMDILDAGINIVQLTPETVYRHEKSDMVDIMRAIIDLSRGHNESVMKSDRIGKAWAERKQRAREGGETITSTLPGWIELRGGKRSIKPGAKATIKRIFHLSARGHGSMRIERLFIKEGIPYFCVGGRWTRLYIRRLLKDRRLLGEHQPRIKETGEPDGPVILDYFPRVIEDTEFYAAMRGRESRVPVPCDLTPIELSSVEAMHKTGNTVIDMARKLGVNRHKVYRALVRLGVRREPAGEKPQGVYLFNGMVYQGERRCYLRTARVGDAYTRELTGEGTSFPYFTFERALLHELKEINPREVLDEANGHDDVVALEGELGAVDARITELEGELLTGDVKAIVRVLRQLETRQAELSRQLADARQKASNPLSAAWGEAKTLLDALDSAPNREDARVRLRAVLRRIADSIHMVVVRRGVARVAGVQIWFAGGERQRSYLIVHQRALGNAVAKKPEEHWCDSLATVADAEDLDLRRAEDAEALAQVLAEMDLAKFMTEERRF